MSLRVERAGAVATVTIERPEVKNALDPETIRALGAALTALEDDDELLAVVLTGAGDEVFVAGGDLKALQKVEGAEAGRRMARLTQRVFARLEALGRRTHLPVTAYAIGDPAMPADVRAARAVLSPARPIEVQEPGNFPFPQWLHFHPPVR